MMDAATLAQEVIEVTAPAPELPAYAPPPEPVTWQFPRPIQFGPASYTSVTLRAPTAAEVLKAGALPNAAPLDMTLRLIAAVSGDAIPYEALVHVSAWQIGQMADYMDSFAGAPMPDPLEAWRRARVARFAPG
jgi:hypothetical protein